MGATRKYSFTTGRLDWAVRASDLPQYFSIQLFDSTLSDHIEGMLRNLHEPTNVDPGDDRLLIIHLYLIDAWETWDNTTNTVNMPEQRLHNLEREVRTLRQELQRSA